jgi:hypothetical protein
MQSQIYSAPDLVLVIGAIGACVAGIIRARKCNGQLQKTQIAAVVSRQLLDGQPGVMHDVSVFDPSLLFDVKILHFASGPSTLLVLIADPTESACWWTEFCR